MGGTPSICAITMAGNGAANDSMMSTGTPTGSSAMSESTTSVIACVRARTTGGANTRDTKRRMRV